MKEIIGLGGTFASGKDTAADIIEKYFKYLHISTGDIVRVEAKKQGKSTHRQEIYEVANKLRNNEGPDILVRRALSEYQSSKAKGLVISGIRNPIEVDALHRAGGYFIFVDADIKLRYERAKKRGRLEDNTTFECFRRQEEREMQNADPAAQNISAVRKKADLILQNDSTLDNFKQSLIGGVNG